MSFVEVPMFRVVCDRCGVSAQEDGDFYAWVDKDQAVEEASNSNWLIRDDGSHWCEDCTVYDEEADEYVPRPEAVAS